MNLFVGSAQVSGRVGHLYHISYEPLEPRDLRGSLERELWGILHGLI